MYQRKWLVIYEEMGFIIIFIFIKRQEDIICLLMYFDVSYTTLK